MTLRAFLCLIGLHRWEGTPPDPTSPADAVEGCDPDTGWAQKECSWCRRRQVWRADYSGWGPGWWQDFSDSPSPATPPRPPSS